MGVSSRLTFQNWIFSFTVVGMKFKVMRYNGMNKILILILLTICLSLVSCGESHEGKARTPESNALQKGRNVYKVQHIFEEAGFTNITLEPIDDLVFGWLVKDGEVEEILVGGDNSYKIGQWVDANTSIIIRYHTFPMITNDDEKASIETEDDKLVPRSDHKEELVKEDEINIENLTLVPTEELVQTIIPTKEPIPSPEPTIVPTPILSNEEIVSDFRKEEVDWCKDSCANSFIENYNLMNPDDKITHDMIDESTLSFTHTRIIFLNGIQYDIGDTDGYESYSCSSNLDYSDENKKTFIQYVKRLVTASDYDDFRLMNFSDGDYPRYIKLEQGEYEGYYEEGKAGEVFSFRLYYGLPW